MNWKRAVWYLIFTFVISSISETSFFGWHFWHAASPEEKLADMIASLPLIFGVAILIGLARKPKP